MLKSLRSRLIVFNAFMLAFFGLVLVSITYVQMRSEILSGLDKEFNALLYGQQTVAKNWIDSKVSLISTQATNINRPDAIPFLAQTAAGGHFGGGVYAGFEDGRKPIFNDNWQPPADYKYADRPWYAQTKANNRVTLTDPYVDAQTKKMTMTVAVPFTTGGKFAGVVAGDVFVEDLVHSVLSAKIRAGGYMFIVNRAGNLIGHPKPELTMKPLVSIAPALTATEIDRVSQIDPVQDAVISDESVLWQAVNVPGTDWFICAAVDKAEVLAPLHTLLYTLIGLTLLVLVLMVPVASFVITRMFGGLMALKGAMVEVSKGEGDLTLRLDESGAEEIAETARAFNQFVGRLQNMFSNLRSDASTLIGGVQQVSQLVGGVATSSREMSDVSSSNAATLEEITVSISHIAESAHQADDLVNHTERRLGENAESIGRLSSGMEGTVSSVRGLENMLASLDKRSEEISGITNVIRDIADQTNLLALNAAIEAARAGEQGRGFAVVADEVRKLAERTAQATLGISSMVEAIRQETSRAVDDMNQTVSSVDEGVQLTREAVEGIGAIRQSMDEVVDKMSEIAHSTNEQHNASTLIAQSTESINSRILENDDRLQNVSEELSRLAKAAQQMQDAFGRFKL
ncbi:methyl-accepting chemotaxis protein [Paludibacterium purpuratum]|uniref:Methyl-accepting chemotaxis sensory transducer with Cache sensor n=1 Tax=Paludibacterium purpuratum TaxID=1144873 RepID=A0A4R7B3V2_9NEIS|nr:methyl-accepting chemotaxis protein [Paludibacterium purpuratum]TDR76665.1 methyl-accepting chemotaxis sensory transducer with Cache sensor [Paludibacterium purpuratum]